MIIYADTRPLERQVPPPWLVGAHDLHSREGLGVPFRWWGIGSPWLLGEQPTAAWHDLPDGWRCCQLPEDDGHRAPPAPVRRQLWCDTGMAVDLVGRVWAAPRILAPDGSVIYRFAYGLDWLPLLTPDQQRADDVAKAARAALLAAKAGGPQPDVRTCCQWAAELLSRTHHIEVPVLAVEGLIDDNLVTSTLSMSTGVPIVVADV